MKYPFLLLAGPALSLSLLTAAPGASACGGCAAPSDTNTQVTGHRMILSVSKTQTTLYDQVQYSGEPESFAWFLPIKGQVQVGLSADALFGILSSQSQVSVQAPVLPCTRSGRNGGLAAADSSQGEGSGTYVPPDEDVTVLSHATVGPYETVQLEAKNPGALTSWLKEHGYSVPTDVEPVIAAYQQEGFDFLAMKLVPGKGVSSMRPVRVTTPGAGIALPLRMVAVGTGAFTPVLLHVVSEGRYEVANQPNLRIKPESLVWDWDSNLSNYRSLRETVLQESGFVGWLTESAGQFDKTVALNLAKYAVDSNPGQTGWGDPENGVSEGADAAADIDTLFAGMTPQQTWMTRMYANLSRSALLSDLSLQAASEQQAVPRFLQAKQSTGTPPCTDDFACSLPSSPRGAGAPAALATGLLAALAWLRRRRA